MGCPTAFGLASDTNGSCHTPAMTCSTILPSPRRRRLTRLTSRDSSRATCPSAAAASTAPKASNFSFRKRKWRQAWPTTSCRDVSARVRSFQARQLVGQRPACLLPITTNTSRTLAPSSSLGRTLTVTSGVTSAVLATNVTPFRCPTTTASATTILSFLCPGPRDRCPLKWQMIAQELTELTTKKVPLVYRGRPIESCKD